MLIGVGGDLLALGNKTALRSGAAGTITATYRLDADGNQYANSSSGTDATASVGYWVSPNGSAANYECSATLTSGSVTTGDTTGSWLALTASRSWTLSLSGTDNVTAVLSISIRRAGVGSALVTSSITLHTIHS